MTQSHETIRNIHAQVLDSCIAVIISRPVIRENYLVQKIPLYIDKQPSSKPHPNQLVLPVTTLKQGVVERSLVSQGPMLIFDTED